MTPEMLTRARDNARAYGKGTTPGNVEFLQGHIDNMPLASDSARKKESAPKLTRQRPIKA